MADREEVVARLAARGVTKCLCVMVDNAGVNRVKLIPLERLGRVASSGVGFSRGMSLYTAADRVAETRQFDAALGDIRAVPDLGSAYVLDGVDGWALCCVDLRSVAGEPLAVCPRTVLAAHVRRARDEHGLELRMAFEVEFTVLGADGRPVHGGPAYSARSLVATPLADDLLERLAASGVAVEQLHAEYGRGQLEVSVEPLDPVAAVDCYVATRWLIAALAARDGLRVSFAPLAELDGMGNGAHLHLSATRDGAGLLAHAGDGPLPGEEGQALIAGILADLPGALAVYAPSVPSYWRLAPGRWAGADACWGVRNREAALRLLDARGASANVELKVVDGSANPYLAAAAMLGSALHGLRERTALGPAVQVNPAELGAAERRRLGVAALPRSLAEAIELAERTGALARHLGPELAELVLATRRSDEAHDAGRDRDAVLAEHLDRYG